MAGEGGTTPPPPLRLKDLLELDCDSCSAAGFRCYPRRLGESASAPMRRHHLLESSPSLSLRRHRPSKLSHLSRSLSRRLSRRGGFWSRRRDEEADEDDAAAATAASAGCGGSSSSSSSEELETSSSESSDNSSSGRTSRRSRSESDSDFSSATEDSVHHHPSQAAAAGDEHEEVAMKTVVSKEKEGSSPSSGSETDDKEQLSPVGVMDFPFDDDEEEGELRDAAAVACSPSFSLARLQRRKTPKIRRFGSCDELAPLDLKARLATTSDPAAAAADPPQQQMIQCRTEDAATPACAGSVHDVPDEDDDLTSLLMGMPVSAGLDDDASERLVLDFFVEMKRRRRSDAHDAEAELLLTGPGASGGVLRRKAERVVDGEAVAAAARGWLEGTGPGTERWGLADVLSGGAAMVAEMERGRRWMQVDEEEREVGAVVAGMLVDQLVIEVVRCLFV